MFKKMDAALEMYVSVWDGYPKQKKYVLWLTEK